MEFLAADDACCASAGNKTENADLSFLPKSLIAQCRSLVESYHELHGYSCLPDILWKSRLEHFIEAHDEFRQLLRKASTTRSAKKSNENFALIATTILSLEVLASSFARWSTIYPEASLIAHAILRGQARSSQMPLMEFYLYPPKYISSAAIAALVPPPDLELRHAELGRASGPDPLDGKRNLDYAATMHQAQHGKRLWTEAALPT